jgi:hypothetical protein
MMTLYGAKLVQLSRNYTDLFFAAVGDSALKILLPSPTAFKKIIVNTKQNYILCLIFKRCRRRRWKIVGVGA